MLNLGRRNSSDVYQRSMRLLLQVVMIPLVDEGFGKIRVSLVRRRF